MYRDMRNVKLQKSHNERNGKGGFTLVELSVVLALIAMLITATVSFSVLMNGYSTKNEAEYEFLEDHATVKNAVCTFASEYDVPGNVFTMKGDGTFAVNDNGTERNVSFSDGVLSLGGRRTEDLDGIDGISFTTNGNLIKCVTYNTGNDGVRNESSFVFSLRIATIDTGGGNQ